MEQKLILAKLIYNNDLTLPDHPDNDVWDPKNDHERMVVL
jgi:hypothetical protein